MPNEEEFIIAGDPALLRALHDAFRDDPDVSVLSGSGDLSAPRRLVVRLSPERAELLSKALGGAVLVELNQELRPPGGQ